MKFEVGKEYVSADTSGGRMRVVAANEWGAAFEWLAGGPVGSLACCCYAESHWIPAPRVVERWIVVRDNGESFTFSDEVPAQSFAASCKPGTARANGPFPCEAP